MEKVIDFLKKNNVMTLATLAGDKPRASILEYYMVGNSILFATSPSSIKAKNMEQNKHVSISVNNMPHFVTVDGSVTEPTKEEIDTYNKQLLTNHPEFIEMINSGMMEPFVYYKVVIDTAYYNDYSKGMAPTQIIKG